MLTLRLTQIRRGEAAYGVQLTLAGPNLHRHIDLPDRSLFLNEQDQEDMRWYFEDYLQYPFDPAPAIANRIEHRLAELGKKLFDSVFLINDHARDVWKELSDHLHATRFEVVTPVRETPTIPWELLFEPQTNSHLALRCQSFVRVISGVTGNQQLARAVTENGSGPIRILLIISRPSDSGAVPFRSVASRLLKSLDGRIDFEVDVLRPPTFAKLSEQLSDAQAKNRPYHVVHFDGHGVYTDPQAMITNRPAKRRRGYLLFENPDDHKSELIHGTLLGGILTQAKVPLLVLNACRSAQAETPAEPGKGSTETHARAFGSLAQEVVEAGVQGVVAMRYNVFVVTAANFMADLYAALVQGQTLGEAVTQGRKELHEHQGREFAYVSRELQDWSVPIVFESAPVALFTKTAVESAVASNDSVFRSVSVASLGNVPEPPNAGFIGGDEILLDLERAFNAQQIVLLHAYAGSGKTTAAAEFARWYKATGGIEGPILFTSFERHTPLARVLETVKSAFDERLDQRGIDWQALDVAARREESLRLLNEISTLWVWDNIETVAGFASGSDTTWTTAEQQELADFLREAQQTQSRFLLTSRHIECEWLSGLAVWAIPLPPMPMLDRVQLLRSIAEERRQLPDNILDWLPLLEYTQGNPLTITVVVGQALREQFKTKEQLDSFVESLRAGDSAFDDEPSEGRSKSLGASLSYGLEHSFSDDELRILALLRLFQGFVDVTMLYWMGHPEIGDLPLLRDVSRETRIHLLTRAANIGLLTPFKGTAEGVGYGIHPALPWFFKKLFDNYYPESASGETENSRLQATRAYASAIGATGVYYHEHYYDRGNVNVIDPLKRSEANLHHALSISLAHSWWTIAISIMQGLDTLYDHTGARAEWERLLSKVVPDFVEPATNKALPGREAEWNQITEYRVALAIKKRRWEEAEQLQLVRVEWERERAAPLLDKPAPELDKIQRRSISALAVSLSWLADIQKALDKSECVSLYEEAIQFYQRLDERRAESSAAARISDAYRELSNLHDLEQAEHWYKQSLQLLDQQDHLARSRRLADLGSLAYERYDIAQKADQPQEVRLNHLEIARQHYEEVRRLLNLLPAESVSDLAAAHNQLGIIYDTRANPGDFDRAFLHYQEAIRYEEILGHLYNAASTRINLATALCGKGDYAKALLYAHEALKNFDSYGERAMEETDWVRQKIENIEQQLKAKGDNLNEHVRMV